MICDTRAVCEAPCAPSPYTSDTYQRNALLLLLTEIAFDLNQEAPTPQKIIEDNPCLTCLGEATLRAKNAQQICEGIFGFFSLCDSDQIRCLTPVQVQALINYYTCFILNEITPI